MKIQTVAMNLLLLLNLHVLRHLTFLCHWSMNHIFQYHRGPASGPTYYLERHSWTLNNRNLITLNRNMQGNRMCLTMRESTSWLCQNSTREETAFLVQGSRDGTTVCLQNSSKLPNIYKHFFPQIYAAWECTISTVNWSGNGSTCSIWIGDHNLYWPVTFTDSKLKLRFP